MGSYRYVNYLDTMGDLLPEHNGQIKRFARAVIAGRGVGLYGVSATGVGRCGLGRGDCRRGGLRQRGLYGRGGRAHCSGGQRCIRNRRRGNSGC